MLVGGLDKVGFEGGVWGGGANTDIYFGISTKLVKLVHLGVI